jgi:transposase
VNTQEVTLGIEVKLLINYQVYILRMSYSQVTDMLWDLYRLSIASGEITNVLAFSAIRLKGAYARLEKRILENKSLHLDEAQWQTGKDKNYVWVVAAGESEECLFLTGKNRGKGNVEKLLKAYEGVRVTDCYAAYKNLPGKHQVCWVKFLRKARDLSTNSNLSEEKRAFSKEVHRDLGLLYREVKTIIASEIAGEEKEKLIPSLKGKIEGITDKIEKSPLHIKKLSNLRDLLLEYEDQLFTCIDHVGVEPNNNKAERKLRHLVLKRKNSFGTKTEKGNELFSINASVLLSVWWQERDEFFNKFKELLLNDTQGNEVKDNAGE